ncbi:Peroxisome biogenesis protein 2 [Tetrabaena socialis]|uniref:Peroxisome biogenesis protein 2 n=1 Tax=Tetrabaena socialis TaxID=47790 RepID=A0A2J7ZVP7_9CHLO|nr:Peroxisome biogenesis protein 2 [Tetrabaena socialis]|eukprot:PNH04329.1 Peroxisome biogenesis protein 2 [Tetrabaena socialis]
MTRIISFEYLNRQLVWQGLAEALLLLLPLVDTAALRRRVMRVLPRPGAGPGPLPAAPRVAPAAPGGPPPDDRRLLEGAAGAAGQPQPPAEPAQPPEPERPPCCPLCGTDDILTAVRALPCGHPFCYYCLRAHTAADAGFCCPLDGVRVAAMRRLGPAGRGRLRVPSG